MMVWTTFMSHGKAKSTSTQTPSSPRRSCGTTRAPDCRSRSRSSCEDPDERGCVTYDLPSSVMSFTDNPELHQAAAALDAKLTSFVENLTGVPA